MEPNQPKNPTAKKTRNRKQLSPLTLSSTRLKKSKPTYRSAKKKAWDTFSKYVRLRDALKTTGTLEWVKCYTCEARIPSTGPQCAQAGHFIQGRGMSLLFDERGVHAQCYADNVIRKGNVVEYFFKMRDEYGMEVIEELRELNRETKKYTVPELLRLVEKYTEKIKELEGSGE